jgi:hypothetical protein
MRVIINVGLLPAATSGCTLDENGRARKAAAWALEHLQGPCALELRRDTAEPTLVIEGDVFTGEVVFHRMLTELAEELGQDCIAYMLQRIDHANRCHRFVGGLAGPNAAAWAPFDRNLFTELPRGTLR